MDDDAHFDEELDVRGLGCAGVLIELARLNRSRTMPWSVIVETDDAGAPQELPAWCRLTHNTFVGPLTETTNSYHLILQPKAGQP